MTYSRHMGVQPLGFYGLGLAAGDTRQRAHDRWWLIMNRDDTRLNKLNDAMRRQRFAPLRWELHGSIEGDNYEIREGRPSMQDLKALWVRHGKILDWWPGAKDEYNFGPNTRSSKSLRISEVFYRYITDPAAPMYGVHKDGYTRLKYRDPLLNTIRGRLIGAGYLPAHESVSTKDNSAYVRALRTIYEKVREERGGRLKGANNNDWWPGGINFGPNTDHNELRIHPEFLDMLLNQPLPASQSAQGAMTIKGAVMGPLPSIRPGGRPTWTQQPAAFRAALNIGQRAGMYRLLLGN